MSNKSKVEYLYHYTNIYSLALILKSKNIKFNLLRNMDDLEEVKTDGLNNFGKYCFVSSWTSSAEESIPFWHMYTNDMAGARIKMPKDMFKKYDRRNIGKEGDLKAFLQKVNSILINIQFKYMEKVY